MDKVEDDQPVFIEKDEKEVKQEIVKEEIKIDPQPNPPKESDWRLVKYFDEMNNIGDCPPENPDLDELEACMSNCTDTDIDDSASVLYAYNYLKEYVQHMKSARRAKDNLMSALPSQERRSPPLMQDSDTSLTSSLPLKPYSDPNTTSEEKMSANYDHIQPRDDTYYASMKLRSEYKPNNIVRRTMSDGPEKNIEQRNGYAIPYVTNHSKTLPQYARMPMHGTVSHSHPHTGARHEQAEVVEICPPSDTSVCSTAYWQPEYRKEDVLYESIEKIQIRQDSDDYFIPRSNDRQNNSDSSSHNQPKLCDSITQKKRKFKRPNRNSKVYMTTNRVFHHPIIHSKECLDSLNSDEVRPCNCLKTVAANQNHKSQQSPSQHVHVMESIQDGEISNFQSVFKKKLNRTRAIPYPDSNISSNNSSEQNYMDDFENYDHTDHHLPAVRSYSYQHNIAPTFDVNSQYPNSFSHHPDRDHFERDDPTSSPHMYMPSERWNFAFQPYDSSSLSDSKPRVRRHYSVDTVPGSNPMERAHIVHDFKPNLSSKGSKESSLKSERSSSRSSRGSSSTDTKDSPKKFFKNISNIFSKNAPPPASNPVGPQVSEL